MVSVHEQNLLEGFGKALRWAQREYPDRNFYIRIDDEVDYDRRVYAFAIGDKYIATYPHPSSAYGIEQYFELAQRAVQRELEVT